MSIRSFVLGLVVGAAVASGVFMLFGDEIFGTMAETTKGIGEKVQKVGQDIEKTGDRLKK